ncbi:DMT family transporter [[Eubacterium] cellulosolvens]
MSSRFDFIIGLLVIFAAIALYATVEVITKLIQVDATAYQINFFRLFLGNGLLYSIIVFFSKGFARFVRKNLKKVIFAGGLWSAFGSTLYFVGITWTSASHAALIFSANPIFSTVLAIAILQEYVTWKKIVGAIMGLFGMIVVITQLNLNFLSFGTLQGDLLIVLSVLLWSLYLVMGVMYTTPDTQQEYSPLLGQLYYLCSTFSFGLLFLLPLVIIDISQNPINLTGETITLLLHLGVITNGVAYILYFWGISRIGVAKGSVTFFLKPIIASLLAFIILDEDVLSASFIAGALLILIAVSIVMKG